MADEPITHVKDLIPDPDNARSHNERNIGMLADALQQVGAARSIVVDEHGVILAGNGTIEAAAQVGITKVQIVDADGETIVAVRRTGLTPEQKTKLALYDNRTAELATWNPDVLKNLHAEGVNLDPLFSAVEQEKLLAVVTAEPTSDNPGPRAKAQPMIECPNCREIFTPAKPKR
jgi:hypothetical protein